MKSTLLARLGLILLITPLAATAQQFGDFTYTNDCCAVTITVYTGPGGAVTIPDTISGLPVTTIGDYAFFDDEELTSVTIPNSVTSIGYQTFFECLNLTNVTIPDSVISIGYQAFSDCGSLTSVTIGSGVTSIEGEAFAYCLSLTAITVDPANPFYSSMDGVVFDKDQNALIRYPLGKAGGYIIPASVTNISYQAFSDCGSLTSVTIGSRVTSIGEEAFADCSLTNVAIPESVTSIGYHAFFYCWNLTNVTVGSGVTSIPGGPFARCGRLAAITVDAANAFYMSVDGILFDKDQNALIQVPARKTGSFIIPDSVTNIADSAFSYCTVLTSVTVPNSVTSIGDSAFESCENLTSLNIGNGVTSIGDQAFIDCTHLTSLTIPDSVTSIGDQAFYDCRSLASFSIPNGVTSIGDQAFYDCLSLTNVIIPNSVTSIGDYAFNSCTSLTDIAIPNSVTSIGAWAFNSCTSLTSVTIPASVSSIGSQVFYRCFNLGAAYFLGNAPADPGHVFDYDAVIVYYLPGTTGWSPFWSVRPTELWNPQASALGVTGGHFGFDITGPSNTVIVVEACTNLAEPVWLPVSTNALDGGGASSFSDSQSGNYPARFYRFRSP